MNIYVGNLSWGVDDDMLRGAFGEFGEVSRASVVKDRDTGRSKGFGFVEMDDTSGKAAIAALDGKELDGRNLRVNEARPREDRPRREGGGGGAGGAGRQNRW